MKRILFIFLLTSFQGWAQEEMSKWYFGQSAGLNFSEGCPDPLINGDIDTIEATSVMSDAEGNLLFYTNGEEIFNRNHNIMENGSSIRGHKSSSSGALIVPFPSDPNKYYVFTADAVQFYLLLEVGVGLNYSVVDMSLDNGLGAVVQKNVNLIEESSEKLTGVAIGDDYWIITHTGVDFYSYRISNGGISSPIISTFPPDIMNFNNFRGVMKVSPDGKRIAVAHVFTEPFLYAEVWLYDFDTNTGLLSNPTLLGDEIIYYGVEFSPNSEVLYVSAKEVINGGLETGDAVLIQYNLNAIEISNSAYIVDTFPSSSLVNLAGGLQNGIDNKLYQTSGGSRLSVVKRPNRLGSDCDYKFGGVSLGGRLTSLGLPNGLQSYYDDIIEYDFLCFEDVTNFQVRTSRAITSINWNFGDPDSGDENTSVEFAPNHIFSSPGSFVVTAEVDYGNEIQVYEVIVKVVISGPLEGLTLNSCVSEEDAESGLTVFNLYNIADALFEDYDEIDVQTVLSFYETEQNALNEEFPIANPFLYENTSVNQVIYIGVSPSLDCLRILPLTLNTLTPEILEPLSLDICYISNTELSSTIDTTPIIDFLNGVYEDQEIGLFTNFENALNLVNPLSGTTSISSQGDVGIFYRLGAASECGQTGFVALSVSPPFTFEDEELTLCDIGDEVVLVAPEGFTDYSWLSGEGTPSITVNSPGIYEVSMRVEGGCEGSKIFRVVGGDTLTALITVEDFQQNNSIIIDAESSSDIVLYSIDGGETYQESGNFKNLIPRTYNVVITNPDFCNVIFETVLIRGAPRFFTPNNDGFNDVWHIIDAENYEGMEVEIFDRYGKKMASLTDTSMGWDGTYNGKQLATNTYWYSVKYNGEVNYGYFTLIVRNL